MAKNTRRLVKSKRGTAKKTKVLKVDSEKKIPKFELQLKNSTINFVLVYADWCGACHKFMNNIWEPMCKGSARHNRLAVRDDMIKNTSLSNANFDYLPSILIVDENGDLQSFKTPEGKDTNAMPTPKSLGDMKKIVNVPVKNINQMNASVINITDPSNPKPVINLNSATNMYANSAANVQNLEDPFSTEMLISNSAKAKANANAKAKANANAKAKASMPNIPNSNIEITENNLSDSSNVVYLPTPMVSPKALPKGFMRNFGKAFRKRLEGTV
jgi:hypothetical protein